MPGLPEDRVMQVQGSSPYKYLALSRNRIGADGKSWRKDRAANIDLAQSDFAR
jgi:hypothetical protein